MVDIGRLVVWLALLVWTLADTTAASDTSSHGYRIIGLGPISLEMVGAGGEALIMRGRLGHAWHACSAAGDRDALKLAHTHGIPRSILKLLCDDQYQNRGLIFKQMPRTHPVGLTRLKTINKQLERYEQAQAKHVSAIVPILAHFDSTTCFQPTAATAAAAAAGDDHQHHRTLQQVLPTHKDARWCAFWVMEDAGTPFDVLQRQAGSMDEDTKLAVLAGMGAMLHQLHSAGIAHGDLNLRNIMSRTGDLAARPLEFRAIDLGMVRPGFEEFAFTIDLALFKSEAAASWDSTVCGKDFMGDAASCPYKVCDMLMARVSKPLAVSDILHLEQQIAELSSPESELRRLACGEGGGVGGGNSRTATTTTTSTGAGGGGGGGGNSSPSRTMRTTTTTSTAAAAGAHMAPHTSVATTAPSARPLFSRLDVTQATTPNAPQ